MGTKESIEATCPECRGPLSVLRTESLVEVRCLVGHTYSPKALLAAHVEAEEKALWAAIVALREAANIVEAAGGQFSPEVLLRLRAQAEKKSAQAEALVAVVEGLEPFEVA